MSAQLVQVATDANLSHLEGGDDPFQMEEAVVFAFTNDGKFRLIISAVDVYEGLDIVSGKTLNQWELGIGIITTGWASPLGADGQPVGAPSEHPLRRRVRLVSCVNKAQRMASAIRFADQPDDLVTDEGEATGSLATALANALMSMVAKGN